ncbi:glycosyltransferase [soil metagenome]
MAHEASAGGVTNTSKSPTVGVIVPMYNARRTIEETLVSICGQTYRSLDIVVIDDGSCDGSGDLVEACAQQDARIRLIRQTNAGVAAARNLGAASTDAPFLAFVDADDIWAPDKIAAQMERLAEEDSAPAVVYCWFAQIDAQSRVFPNGQHRIIEGDVFRRLCRDNFVGNGSSMLMPREIFNRVGGFDSSLHEQRAQGCEDLMFLLAAARNYPFKLVPRCLVGYRLTHENMSSDTSQMLRSFEIVADRFGQELPQFSEEWDAHRRDLIVWLARRAAMAGRMREALGLWRKLRPKHADRAREMLPNLTRLYVRSTLIPKWVKTTATQARLRERLPSYLDKTW